MRRTTPTISTILTLAALVFLSGCVSSGKYQLKVQEAAGQAKTIEDLRMKQSGLTEENSRLAAQVRQMEEELGRRKSEIESLTAGTGRLEASLKSTADAKNQQIAEMSREIGRLEQENERLKGELVRLTRVKEEEISKTSKTYEEMLEKMKGEISRGQVTISELKGRLTVNMLNSILFDSGKADVKPEGLSVLQKVVEILKSVPDKAIRIEGHTDNDPISGELSRRYPSNWELSAARAIHVARYLQQQGIDPQLLTTVAYGEYRPVASNDSEEGKARNRRIEIVLVPKE